jgi:hypothetical protein
MNWITVGDIAGLTLLVIALAVTGISAFGPDSSARPRRRRLLPAARRARTTAMPARPPASSVPAQASWQPRQAASGQAATGQAVPWQRQPGWQSRPAPRALVEDRVPGPAALQLEEAVSPADQ